MKHTLKITLFLVLIFLFSQVIGLTIINKYIQVTKTPQGTTEVTYPDTAIGPVPQMEPSFSFWYIIIAVLIGTIIVLILVRFRKFMIWKTWFLIAVWLSMSVSIGVFIKGGFLSNYDFAMLIALLFAVWKIYRPNIYVHNLTEIFMYAGIALIFVSSLDIKWAIGLLLVISAYDMYAVWKSRHMVKMAEFQAESNVFAGLFIPYKRKQAGKKEETKIQNIKPIKIAKEAPGKEKEASMAILGGGDIAFPLIFSGVVMNSLIRDNLLTKLNAFLLTLIITFFVTLALSILFYKSEKGKYYPAMPFLTAGCLVGYGIVYLLQMII